MKSTNNLSEQKKFISLAYKNAIFYILLILLSSLLIGFFIYKISYNIIYQSTEQNAKHTIDILDVKLQSYFDNIKKDVLFISRSPYLKDYVQAINTKNEEYKREILTADYVSFLSSKPDYAQIRFIGKRNNGKEIIRVDRMNNFVNVIGQQELQEKGSSTYFKETILLPEDSVSFSIIDLNKEHGKLSIPVMATLRASCPIWINNENIGIAVINTNLNALFKELKLTVNKEYYLYLMNQLGQCMIHPDSLLEFAFEYNKKYSFFDELQIQDSIIKFNFSSYNKNGDRYYYKKINYPKKNYSLIVFLKSIDNKLVTAFYNWRWSILGITLMVSALMMLLALWWLRKQSTSMQDIVTSINKFEKGLEAGELPVYRNDEIGIIARTFYTMANTIKRNISNLAIAKKDAEQANIQKEEFLQNMSHEIRNPLHTILGMTQMLEDNKPRVDQYPIIDSLKFSTNTLLALVNDILDFSKLKEGKITLSPRPSKINELLDQIIKSYTFETLSKKIKIEKIIDASIIKHHYIIDPLRFNQVINNLISNAIKFSPPDTNITVECKILNQKDNQCNIKISVLDEGYGIPANKIETILKRFQQLPDTENTNKTVGTGLGLPIVVQLLQLFNSQLEVKSNKPKGSIFSFVLNLTEYTQNQSVSDALPQDSWNKILIIDDDPLINLLYKHIFSSPEIELQLIQNIEALNAITEQKHIDILVTDNNLDQESVIQHLEKLKKLIKPRSVKILLTGDHNLVSLLIASGNFFDCIIQKPISADQLRELIQTVWNWKEYSMPNLMSLYHDYDFDRAKILNALQLLLKEWNDALSLLQKAISQERNEDKNAIIHKLANSLRRFELHAIEEKWEHLDLTGKNNMQAELDDYLTEFKYCIEYIKFQEKIWNS